MRDFFRILRNLIFLTLIAFVVWAYHNNDRVRIATNDSLNTLSQRVTQLFSPGSLASPQVRNKNQTTAEENTTTSKNGGGHRVWTKNSANVYIKIKNNKQLRSATIDAMNAWNRTGVFLFKETEHKKKANIIVSVMDDTGTEAAGQTSTTYNPVTDHLLKAHVQLNKYYLQNSWYGYSNTRIINTIEHELGHAIGLNHNDGVSVMYPKGSYYTIQPRDIKAVKKLYNKN